MNAELISDLESCPRRAFYLRQWEPNILHPTEITRRAIYRALGSEGDVGEAAGAEVMQICSDYYLDVKDDGHLYDTALHHAAIADLVATWVKGSLKGEFRLPADKREGNLSWESGALAWGNQLLRIVLVDHLSDERIASESRAWFTLGEVAVYNVPMTIQFIVLGSSRAGKRHSPWTKALRHPRGKWIRFKPRPGGRTMGFKESWIPLWREDHAEISREAWLKTMQEDGVLEDLTKRATVEKLSPQRRSEVLAIMERKSIAIASLKERPDPCFSACDWPRVCAARAICFAPVPVEPDDLGWRKR